MYEERELTSIIEDIEKQIESFHGKASNAIDTLLELTTEIVKKDLHIDESYDEKLKQAIDTLLEIENKLGDILIALAKVHAAYVNYIQANYIEHTKERKAKDN